MSTSYAPSLIFLNIALNTVPANNGHKINIYWIWLNSHINSEKQMLLLPSFYR